LLNDGAFNFFERKLLRGALRKVSRRETLIGAMNIVVFNNVEGQNRSGAGEADTYNPARGAILGASLKSTFMALQAEQMQQSTHRQSYMQAIKQ
jgi:hypothetical protein